MKFDAGGDQTNDYVAEISLCFELIWIEYLAEVNEPNQIPLPHAGVDSSLSILLPKPKDTL